MFHCHVRVTDWLTDRPTDRPTDWLTDQLTDWPTDQPTDWPTDWPTDQPTDQLTDRTTDQPTNQPTNSIKQSSWKASDSSKCNNILWTRRFSFNIIIPDTPTLSKESFRLPGFYISPYELFVSPIRATSPVLLNIIHLIILTIFGGVQIILKLLIV
jgi:hypothetical protein